MPSDFRSHLAFLLFFYLIFTQTAQAYSPERLPHSQYLNNKGNLDLPGLQTDTVNFARMMAGIAAAITGGNAAENNYLSHWQQAAYNKEMQACTSAACKIGTSLRWGLTSVNQDAALVTGMALGAGIEVKDAAAALAELPQTIAMLANNPELLKGLPDGYVQGLQTTYTSYQTALESAGVDGATAAGVDFTHLLSQLALLPATVATGGAAAGYTVDKMAVLLDRLGTARAVDVAAVGGNLPLMSRPNFYVKSDGTTIPATGYRAIGGEQNIQEASQGVVSSRDPTYLTFDNITNMPGGQIKSLLQLEYPPTHVISFDTKQILNDIAIPNGRWGNFSIPEPLTNTFPEWGNGGGTQAITNLPIKVDSLSPVVKP